MRALRGKVIVKSFENQKEAIVITGEGGKKIELWVGKKFVENHREKNPVICQVVDNNSEYHYIKEGDYLIVHHNYLSEWQTNPFCMEYNPQTGEGLYSFPASSSIFCKLLEDGSAVPVCNNMLVERLKNPVKSSLIYIPETVKQEHNDRVRVISVAPEVDNSLIGNTILMHQYSDYEICYTWNKKDYSVIKVLADELIGVVNS